MRTKLEASVSAFCIPSHAPRVLRPYSITTFRVLVKSPLGRLGKFEVKQRALPERDWLEALGQALDRVALFPEVTAIQDKRKLEYEFNVSWLDENIFDQSRWGCQEWLQSSVMDTVASLNGANYSEDFRSELKTNIKTHLADRLSSIKQELEPLSMELSSTTGVFRCALYNYLQDEDPQIRLARQQALQSFPFLVDRILLNSYHDVRKAIDTRSALAPVLASRFNISVALLRRLNKFSFVEINDRIGKHLNNPETLWPLFSNIPLEKVPNNAEQWAGFKSLIRRIYDLTQLPVKTPLNRSILDQCLTNDYARRLFTGQRWRDTQIALESLLAAWAQISRYVLRGKHSHTEADLRATCLQIALIEKLGLPTLAKLASHWDDAYLQAERICDASLSNVKTGTWPTILKEPIQLGSLVVHPMATARALAIEGKKMDNCVSSYAYSCQRGQCQIWSLRDDEGKSVANLRTYVAELDDLTKAIRLVELKAPKNKEPSQEAIESSELLLEVIKQHPEELEQYLVWQAKTERFSMAQLSEEQYVRPVLIAMKNIMSNQFDLTALFTEMLGEGEDLARLEVAAV